MKKQNDDLNSLQPEIRFYASASESEPVRKWLKELPRREDRKIIGQKIEEVRCYWPTEPPLTKKITKDLYEIRTNISDGIARVLFAQEGLYLLLLHGFIKKDQKLPPKERKTAEKRLEDYRSQHT